MMQEKCSSIRLPFGVALRHLFGFKLRMAQPVPVSGEGAVNGLLLTV